MPKPFHSLTLEEFAELLHSFPFTRRVTEVHMHHTWRPNHSQYRGLASIEAMWRYHTQDRRFSDIAQHLTIAPDGTLWTGRGWNQPPASAQGSNGSRSAGPFMFELIGDFDDGRDSFGGEQARVALSVIAHLQEKFDLPLDRLRFHREFAKKTCPGSAIRREEILRQVGELREGLKHAPRPATQEGPFGPEAFEENARLNSLIQQLSLEGAREFENGELPEEEMDAAAQREVSGVEGFGAPRLAMRGLDTAMRRALRPHVINLAQGEFSTGGDFSTSKEDVDAIFVQLAKELDNAKARDQKLRLLIYAHGGLVSERDGLAIAHAQLEWWRGNGVYPLFFVWETGFLETLAQQWLGARALEARAISDWTDAFLESVARRGGPRKVWSLMKLSAERASAPGGGGAYVAEKLKAFTREGAGIELHAVGHSAGSIFHGHFLPLLTQQLKLNSLHLLAPAIRVDGFLQRLAPLMGERIERTTIFTMFKDYELDDHVGHVYRKSLLYLIHHALEPESGTAILGLEESLRGNDRLVELFGLAGPSDKGGEIVFSVSPTKTGRNTSCSTTHGGFDNDPHTMESVARRVLGLGDTAPLPRPFPRERAQAPELDLRVALQPPSAIAAVPAPGTGALPTATIDGGGRRRAICVGIDGYDRIPLAGCVADAHLWAKTLGSLGFQTELLLEAQATRANILAALEGLIRNARPGDVLVFHFSGHGTELPDLNGDELEGANGDRDEALVPYDYASGAYVIDDDIQQIFQSLPADVNLTCFIDCCHSGTVTRFGIGGAYGSGRQARFLPLTADMVAAHRGYRSTRTLPTAINPRGPAGMREILFSACQDAEVAFESNGQGEFTLHATAILARGLGGHSHKSFLEQVTTAFGPTPRQHPDLDCAPQARGLPLLQSATVTSGVVAPAIESRDCARVGEALRMLAAALGQVTGP